MKLVNDLPFYIVIIAVLINIIIGVFIKLDFTVLMIRSIVVTIVFSVFGFILSEIIKKFIETENNKNDSAAKKDNDEGNYGSSIDIQVPPIDEEELLKYNKEENSKSEEEFFEVNPAYLHKFGQ